MIGICLLSIFIMTFIGLLYPCLAIFGYDVYTRKNKTLKKISRWRKRNVDIWQLRSFNNILQIVAPLIPLSEKTERKMNDDLARADIPYTAQEYYAKAILSSIAGIFLALLGLSMKSYIIVLGGILLSIYLYFHNYDQLKDTLSDKYSIIENEIPTFIRSIESGLHTDRDIIHVMEQYKKIASPALASELDLLISDMRTSSVSAALTRFDSRMGSPEISRLVAALIEVDRGVDASLTLSYLAADMTTMHKQLIQRELDKRPGKMKRAILPAGIILVVMMFYMLIEAVIQSAQGIF